MLVVPVLFLGSFSFVHAAIINVNDATGADIDNGECSIVEAILNANTDGAVGSVDCVWGFGPDTIILNNDVSLTSTFGNPTFRVALPEITSDITIDGNGFKMERVSQSPFRFMYVQDSSINLILKNITLSNGSPEFLAGGSIYMVDAASLNLDNVKIENSQTTGEGGAIYANAVDNVSIKDSKFIGNSAYLGGVFLFNEASVNIVRSVFANNTASPYGGAVAIAYSDLSINETTFSDNQGSAIYTFGGEGENANIDFTVRNSTFSGNQSVTGGGAIRLESTVNLDVSNSTFSGNSSEGASVISNYDSISKININFSTFVGNNSMFNSGAIRLAPSPGQTFIMNNIFTNNSGGDCSYFSMDGMNIFNNLSGDGSCGQTAASGVNLSLLNNGGLTKTHKLLAGSNAIDMAILNYQGMKFKCPLRDQRATARPFDGNNDGINRCDIGAYEYKHIIRDIPAKK